MPYKTEIVDLQKNLPKMIDLWKGNLSDWPEPKFDWFYQQNYYGLPLCWGVSVDDDQKYVGSETIFPRKFYINGHATKAGITGDFVMDTSHRILGPALKLQKSITSTCQESLYDFLLGLPNKQAKPVKLRAGFHSIGRSLELVKLVRSENYLRKFINNKVLLSCTSFVSDILIKLFAKENYSFKNSGLALQIISSFDSRFETLWEKAKKNFVIIGERNPDYLNWRFLQCPYKDYKIAALVSKDLATVQGYIVYFESDDQINIVDLFALDLDTTLNQMMANFLRYVRNINADKVYFHFLGNNNIFNELKSFGFRKRGQGNDVIIFADENSKNFPMIQNQQNWFLTESDIDE